MNKKAQFFMPLFVLVTFIIFTTLYLDFAEKSEQFACNDFSSYACKIGEKQLAVLNTAAEGEKALLYIDISAKYAYETAVLDVAHSGYMTEDMGCGTYRGVPIVYGNADCMSYNEELITEISNALSEKFNDAFVHYAEAYDAVTIPSNNYKLSFKDNTVYGTAQEEMEIPIFSLSSIAVEEKIAEQAPSSSGTLFTQWPVALDEHNVNSCFGYRGDKIKTKSGVKASTNHNGIDIYAPKGTLILAIADGTVTRVSPIRWGYVTINHGNGISSQYLHLDTISVAVGEQITKGQQIGTAGGRGKDGNPNAYDSHLHFSIMDTNINSGITDAEGNSAALSEYTVNPLCYLSQELDYTYKNNIGCRSQGGAYKFCSLYYPVTTSAKEMLLAIDENYGKIIENAITGTAIPKSLVIGVIAQESGGNPDAGSATGCMGLMQFCSATAYGYDLCSNKQCSGTDERTNSEKAIPAGVELLQDNLNSFSAYTDKISFAVASYNSGAGVIKNAIEKTGKSNPSWQEVSTALDADCVTYFETTEQKNTKVIEIRNYVPKVLGYASAYEQLQNANDINTGG
jgi:murein DD-endopeptidase MepM/ murein hydrolase activator NlpD